MVNDPTLWSIRRLDSDVDISGMNCGEEPWGQSVTDFLVSDALQQQQLLINKTTLFYYDGNLIGFVTLAASVLELNQAQQTAIQPEVVEIGHDVPSVLIARLGVDKDHQRNGYGRRIFDWVLAEVIQSSIGARLLLLHVDKENRGGRDFWQECGFHNGSGTKNILMYLDLYPFAARTSI